MFDKSQNSELFDSSNMYPYKGSVCNPGVWIRGFPLYWPMQ